MKKINISDSLKVFILFLGVIVSLSSNAENKSDTVKVMIKTTSGDVVVELFPKKAPKTVKSFLHYVDEGFYKGKIFHRVIKNFMIQAGGYTKEFSQEYSGVSIENESDNGLKNLKGSIAMARTQDVHSASVQFFFNTYDNPFLDYTDGNHGYTVFGKVIKGYDVIENIENEPTRARNGHNDVPIKLVVIRRVIKL